jgi:hypothetical protein
MAKAFWLKKKEKKVPAQVAIADAAEIKQANELGYKYLQDSMAERGAGELEQSMRSLIKSIYCNLTYEDNTFRFDPADRIPDEEWVAPAQRQFLQDNKDLFDESMIEDCLTVPVSNPPVLDRMRAIIYPYVKD